MPRFDIGGGSQGGAFGLQAHVKRWFFNAGSLAAAIDRARKGELSRAGAFVRRNARSRLRRRKRVSVAPEPPSVHSTDSVATLKAIWFAYDPRSQSVVIGPRLLNQAQLVNGSRQSIPGLLEFGGTATIQEERWIGQTTWRRRDLRRNAREDKEYRSRTATYAARPFMGPALREEAPKFPTLFSDSIRAAA